MDQFAFLTEPVLRSLMGEAHKRVIAHRHPLEFLPAIYRPKGVLYGTRLSNLWGLANNWGIQFERDIARWQISTFENSDLVLPPCAAVVACEAKRLKTKVKFVGNLDPWDLTVFLTLTAGLRKHRVSVQYDGIDDHWIDSANATRKERWPAGIALMPMDKDESKFWRMLKQLPIDWRQLIGPTAMQLLEEGNKLAVEGMAAPIYDEKHYKWLRKVLLGKAS